MKGRNLPKYCWYSGRSSKHSSPQYNSRELLL